MCSDNYFYRTNDIEAYATNTLDRIIRHSNALDTESLCILKGVSCWSIRADVHIIDYDGNITDAACIAIMAGLQHFRRPDAHTSLSRLHSTPSMTANMSLLTPPSRRNKLLREILSLALIAQAMSAISRSTQVHPQMPW